MTALQQVSVTTGLRAVDPEAVLPPEAQQKLAILRAESLDADSRVTNRSKKGAPMGDAPAVAGALRMLLAGCDDFIERAGRSGPRINELGGVPVPPDASLERSRDGGGAETGR